MNRPGHRIAACLAKAALKTHALQTLRDSRASPKRAKRLECVRIIGAFRLARDGQRFMVPMHGGKAEEASHDPPVCCRHLASREIGEKLCRQDAGSTLAAPSHLCEVHGRNSTASNSWKLPMNLSMVAVAQKWGTKPTVARFRIGTGALPIGCVSPPELGVGRCSGAFRAAFGVGSRAQIVPRTR